jgi:23S rRNA (cytidine1920-2'-O)/16S rRNA (cytidine1409-2'-O)-methyltransferase
VRRGLVPSRQQAQELIDAGRITVGGAPAMKAARVVGPDEALVVHGPPARFVGRGGLKLEGALDHFAVEVAGLRAYDLGASTGGFTDCLLQRGAASVVALDVGYGQLHERIRANPRVEVHERTNVRDVRPGDLGPPADLVVADLSFISLRTVLPAVLPLLAAEGQLVLLVKPQFEAGRQEAAQGKGVISDPAIWTRVLEDVTSALASAGTAIMGVMASPLTGADGNVEFLVHARASGLDDPAARARWIADAVAAGIRTRAGAG